MGVEIKWRSELNYEYLKAAGYMWVENFLGRPEIVPADWAKKNKKRPLPEPEVVFPGMTAGHSTPVESEHEAMGCFDELQVQFHRVALRSVRASSKRHPGHEWLWLCEIRDFATVEHPDRKVAITMAWIFWKTGVMPQVALDLDERVRGDG